MSKVHDENIARGIAFLDQHVPGWEHRIDLKTLDLSSACNCVVGQVAVDAYLEGIEALGVNRYDFGGRLFPLELGFVVADDGRLTYDGLTRAWVRAIRARLAESPQP